MIQLGIIGCGDVAFRTYFPALELLTGRAAVTACFDPIEERANRAAARFPGATAYTTFEEFLNHPGLAGVFNLTPAPLHKQTTIPALDAGLHVFTEKPISSTVEDALSLIEYAADRNLLLLGAPAVIQTRRFRWLKELIDAGRIGRLTLAVAQISSMGPAGWRVYTGDPAVFYTPDVGPNIDLGVYGLHAITGLFGAAKRVQAFGGITIPKRKVLIPRLAGNEIEVKANDHMLMHLDFGNQSFAQIIASFAIPRSKMPALEIHGDGGSISISTDTWYNGDGPVDIFVRDDSMLGVEGWMNGVTAPDSTSYANMIAAGPAHFVSCIMGEEKPLLTGAHAAHVLEIMLAAQQSVTEGRAIDLETSF
jgi:predicted dehydrogenase